MIKSVSLFLFFLFFKLYTFAQGNTGGGVDDERVHFGFTFQYVSAEYKIYKKNDWRTPKAKEVGLMDSLYGIGSTASPGFGLGFVTNFRLGENADIRFTPALVFSDRLLNYTYSTGTVFQQKVGSTMVDLPLGFKLKSDRRQNFRAYLLAGGKFSSDIISKKKTDDTDRALEAKFVKNKKNFFSYEVAVGFDFYFEYFKLTPEIKLSNSIYKWLVSR
jgi:hypothetical protein